MTDYLYFILCWLIYDTIYELFNFNLDFSDDKLDNFLSQNIFLPTKMFFIEFFVHAYF